MPTASLPLILEPAELHARLAEPGLLIVDLCPAERYRESHIPGAVHLATADLVSGIKPATGSLPSPEQLSFALARIGLTSASHVVCYDDEGGPWAGRLIWTLALIGHTRYSFLNGGKTAWIADGLPLQPGDNLPAAAPRLSIHYNPELIAGQEEIAERLADPNLLVWDARSHDEYTGAKAHSARGGHIPGAIHCEWTRLLDGERHLRLRSDLAAFLVSRGLTPDRDIVTHCQTHRRSGLTWLAAHSLGYPKIRAYPGSWAEWGNREDTPVNTGETP